MKSNFRYFCFVSVNGRVIGIVFLKRLDFFFGRVGEVLTGKKEWVVGFFCGVSV